MREASMQPDLIQTESPDQVDDRLQKRVEEIYTSGSSLAEFFRKVRERSKKEDEEQAIPLPQDALLFRRK